MFEVGTKYLVTHQSGNLDRSHIIAHMQVDPGTHHFMNKKIDTLTSH